MLSVRQSGDIGFVADADWNRDGMIGEDDRIYFEAGFGFVANRAPIVTAGNLEVVSETNSHY